MASRRRRGTGKGGKARLFLAAGAVALAAAGGFWWWQSGGGGGDEVDASVAGVLPDLSGGGEAGGACGGEAINLAGLRRTLAEINASVAASDGEVRNQALRDGYGKLAPLLEGPLPIEERQQAIVIFHAITKELFLSSTHNEFSQNYIVKSGDSIDRIARKAGISNALLTDLNNMPRGYTNLHPGDNLKLPKGEPRLVVRKGDYTTSLYFGESLVRQYVVAHGKNDNTPLGKTTITSMTIDPEKSARGENDPRGEMKLRWIGLATYAGGRSGFGLHGTQHPDSIPGQTSKGCVRMYDDDVVELYDIVRIGNSVEIVG